MTRNAQSCCRCRDEAAVQFVRCWFFRFSFLFYTNIYIFIFIHILLCASFYLRRCLFLLAPDTKTTSKLMDDPSESFHLPFEWMRDAPEMSRIIFKRPAINRRARKSKYLWNINLWPGSRENRFPSTHTHTKKVIISRMWRHLGRATSESFGVVGDIVRVLSPRQAISNA